ncbi:hypothetical protein ACFRFJ_16430 [Streptomyces hydrogenans]|uniref:hypothetical protein n=1 Tax=Streptomyces hydrogenans TaxID=1873719 RepID=UPI0036452E3F
MLTACGGGSSDPKPEASTATSPAAASATTQAPKANPYMDGHAHGQERRTDPEFKSTEKAIIIDPVTGAAKANPKNDTLTVAMRIAEHCQDWAQQKYADSADQDAYAAGCRDGINDRPPTDAASAGS